MFEFLGIFDPQEPDPAPLNTQRLSVALLQAVGDLELVEQSDTVRIDMNSWVKELRGDGDGPVCSVCMAGASLLHRSPETLEVLMFGTVTPLEFNVILALDEVRNYSYRAALMEFYANSPHVEPLTGELTLTGERVDEVVKALLDSVITFCGYREDPEQFKNNMRTIAGKLEEFGL